jgi:Mg/Co/Ni transporter MgtE
MQAPLVDGRRPIIRAARWPSSTVLNGYIDAHVGMTEGAAMFQVHGLAGRWFTTKAETLRRIERVSAPAATAAIETDEVALSRRVEADNAEPDDSPHRPALQAYAQVQGSAGTDEQRRRRPRVGDWMSRRVQRLRTGQTLAEARALLATHHIEQAPVVDADDRLVGLLLQADLVAAPQQGAVEGCMRSPVPATAAETDLRQLSLALLNTGLPGMPVTGPLGELVGFITRGDVLRAVATEPPLDLWG